MIERLRDRERNLCDTSCQSGINPYDHQAQEADRLALGVQPAHGYRHSMATNSLANGAGLKTVSARWPQPHIATNGAKQRHSDCIFKLKRITVVPPDGIEPPTFGLQNRCSTS